jgi:hypothetical protein
MVRNLGLQYAREMELTSFSNSGCLHRTSPANGVSISTSFPPILVLLVQIPIHDAKFFKERDCMGELTNLDTSGEPKE